MEKNIIGLAGEYHVLAQLAQRNLVATMTLSNTKGIDILVTNQDINKLYKIEVKTSSKKLVKERLFGKKPFYAWTMSEKHENIKDNNLYYVFVALRGYGELPKFFIVPSKKVARYVKWQHEYWLQSRKAKVNNTTMRKFRISVDDPNGYENNWRVFMDR